MATGRDRAKVKEGATVERTDERYHGGDITPLTKGIDADGQDASVKARTQQNRAREKSVPPPADDEGREAVAADPPVASDKPSK